MISNRRKLAKFGSRIPVYLFLLAVTVIALFPIVYIFLASFKTNFEIMIGGPHILPQEGWQFHNYKRAWELANFSQYTYNSLYLAFFIVIGCIYTATTAGYVFFPEDVLSLQRLFTTWFFPRSLFLSGH